MQIRRTTNILFNSQVELINAFSELGINIRYTDKSEIYIDPLDGKKLTYYEKNILEKHGIICKRGIRWSRKTDNWEASWRVKELLGTDMTTYPRYSIVECITYNKSEEEHKEEVSKLYSKFKTFGYDVTHSCETEITGDEC